jgi:hypothetical protein
MTNLEFDILDELYFVISFDELVQKSELKEDDLIVGLKSLYDKRWIKILKTHDEEVFNVDLTVNYHNYFYLATKQGLLAHNLR